MRKLFYYTGVMIAVIIVLPLLIVKGCYYQEEKTPELAQKQQKSEKILVYDSVREKTVEMDFEEYIKGVVAAEMPADFDGEALKAQAVTARTFAYGRKQHIYEPKAGTHDGADICTDPAHDQAWISKEDAMKKWGIFKASRNWSKIEKAVTETRGIIITYDNKVVNALFHANSGGATENSGDVWDGVQVPYLKSVKSYGEDAANDFKVSVTFGINEFVAALKNKYPESKLTAKNIPGGIKILGYTEGGRVKSIKIGDITMKGTELRSLFNLRSANFKIEKADKDNLKITTLGYGHGVGMSQWGANYLAKRGGTFDEIIKYYYSGVDLVNIQEYGKLSAQ